MKAKNGIENRRTMRYVKRVCRQKGLRPIIEQRSTNIDVFKVENAHKKQSCVMFHSSSIPEHDNIFLWRIF